jgi:hypothetical protein
MEANGESGNIANMHVTGLNAKDKIGDDFQLSFKISSMHFTEVTLALK